MAGRATPSAQNDPGRPAGGQREAAECGRWHERSMGGYDWHWLPVAEPLAPGLAPLAAGPAPDQPPPRS